MEDQSWVQPLLHNHVELLLRDCAMGAGRETNGRLGVHTLLRRLAEGA